MKFTQTELVRLAHAVRVAEHQLKKDIEAFKESAAAHARLVATLTTSLSECEALRARFEAEGFC